MTNRRLFSLSAYAMRTVILVFTAAASATVSAASPKMRCDDSIQDRGAGGRRLAHTDGPLRITAVRLEAAEGGTATPSVVLTFNTENDGPSRIADIVLAVSLVEMTKQDHEQHVASPRVLLGPLTVRTDVVLEPGYTVTYEMLLRNVPHTCHCSADVQVVAFRVLRNYRPALLDCGFCNAGRNRPPSV